MKAALNHTKHDFNIKEAVAYSMKGIKKICEKIGPRPPGSPEELRSQEWMAKDLKNWADSVKIEEFRVHRQAFMGFIPFTVLMALASIPIYFLLSPLVSMIMLIAAIIPLVLEFVMYRQFIDKLFLGHTSHNVMAVRKPKAETKRRIILVGHADSQYEWTLNYKLGGTGMKLVLIPAVIGLLYNLAVAIAYMIAKGGITPGRPEGVWAVLGFLMLLFVPSEFGFFFFQSYTKSVPGAADNLSGCYVGMSVLKCLDEAGARFDHTEVCCLISGSEEAGLRGAKAYAKAHKEELLENDTVVIGLDTFRDLKDLAVYDRDLSGTLKHHTGVKELMREACANCGYDAPYASIYLGACDAAAFTQIGVPATGFAAMDPTPPRYYHTRLDTPENLKDDALEAGIACVLEACCLYDEKGVRDCKK